MSRGRTSIKVEGLIELRKKLEQLGPAVTRAARKEVVRSALRIQKQAREDVPVDTGRLRNSIAVAGALEKLDQASQQATAKVRAKNDIPKEPEAVVGTNVEYAKFVEFGAADVVNFRVRQVARPYLHPAAEQERPRLRRNLRKAVNDAIQDVSRGLNRSVQEEALAAANARIDQLFGEG